MSAAHQRFSAESRRSGELDKPAGKRRRNLDTGRLSVVFGADAACVIEDLAAKDNRSVGGFVRKVTLEYLTRIHGLHGEGLAARAAELRAAKAAQSDGYQCSQEPHPGTEFYGPGGGCAECGFRPAPATPAAL